MTGDTPAGCSRLCRQASPENDGVQRVWVSAIRHREAEMKVEGMPDGVDEPELFAFGKRRQFSLQ